MFNKSERNGFLSKLNLFKSIKRPGKDTLNKDFSDNRFKWRELLNHIEKKPLPQRDLDTLLYQMKQRIDTKEARSVQRNVWAPNRRRCASFIARPAFGFALALVLLLGGTFYLYNKHIGTNTLKVLANQYETINVEYGKRAKFVLSDGSVIIADAGSEIKYPTVFSGTRDIYLKGEAYFQVAKDPQRPFIVHANQAVVQVYGTKFNIRAWDENPIVTVAVKEGKVSLANESDTTSAVFLTKNQMSQLKPHGQPTKAVTSNVLEHTSWMNYEIKFENATINEILAQLQRWYNYEITVQDPTILNDRMTVHIIKTNVDDVLQVISLLTNSEIDRDSTKINIIPKH